MAWWYHITLYSHRCSWERGKIVWRTEPFWFIGAKLYFFRNVAGEPLRSIWDSPSSALWGLSNGVSCSLQCTKLLRVWLMREFPRETWEMFAKLKVHVHIHIHAHAHRHPSIQNFIHTHPCTLHTQTCRWGTDIERNEVKNALFTNTHTYAHEHIHTGAHTYRQTDRYAYSTQKYTLSHIHTHTGTHIQPYVCTQTYTHWHIHIHTGAQCELLLRNNCTQ